MPSIFEKLISKLETNSIQSESVQKSDAIRKHRKDYKYAMAKALLPIALITSSASCVLARQGLGSIETEADAGVGGEAGSAGEGGIAGQGGSADEAGNGGEAGAGGCVPTEEICDGEDNNCNDQTDENLVAPLCDKTEGVCATPAKYPECDGENGWTACEYNSDYENDSEYTCDGLDNDCDGETDEMTDLDGFQPACAEDNKGVCAGATAARTCESGQWSDCNYGPDYSNGPESSPAHCTDQLDNDCDGQTDCDDSDCNNVCKAVITLAVPPNVCHKQARLASPGASNWIAAGSSNNDTLCTLNEISFVPNSGNRLVLWVDSHNTITVSTMTSIPQVSAGCSNYNYNAPNAPSLPNLVNEEKIITFDTDVTADVNENEITYTHNITCSSPTNNHVFVLDYQ